MPVFCSSQPHSPFAGGRLDRTAASQRYVRMAVPKDGLKAQLSNLKLNGAFIIYPPPIHETAGHRIIF